MQVESLSLLVNTWEGGMTIAYIFVFSLQNASCLVLAARHASASSAVSFGEKKTENH